MAASKQARDEGWKKVMADQRMQPGQNAHAVRRQAHDLRRLAVDHLIPSGPPPCVA